MKRQQLLDRLADIDKEIDFALKASKAPSLDVRKQNFPSGTVGAGIVFLAMWLFSRELLGIFVPVPEWWGWAEIFLLVFGILFVVAGVFQIITWAARKAKPTSSSEYREANERVRELKARRSELQRQIKDLD